MPSDLGCDRPCCICCHDEACGLVASDATSLHRVTPVRDGRRCLPAPRPPPRCSPACCLVGTRPRPARRTRLQTRPWAQPSRRATLTDLAAELPPPPRSLRTFQPEPRRPQSTGPPRRRRLGLGASIQVVRPQSPTRSNACHTKPLGWLFAGLEHCRLPVSPPVCPSRTSSIALDMSECGHLIWPHFGHLSS